MIAAFPNDHVVRASGLGQVVENGNMPLLAEQVERAMNRDWDRQAAVDYTLAQHTWDLRAGVYDRLIRQRLGGWVG